MVEKYVPGPLLTLPAREHRTQQRLEKPVLSWTKPAVPDVTEAREFGSIR